MERIYLDNAATTMLGPEVLEAMLPFMQQSYGNASSVHFTGRKARTAVEQSRKSVAEMLGVNPSCIIFTSGGTEANNMAIASTTESGVVKNIVTSAVEHHAVLNPIKKTTLPVSFVTVNESGLIDLEDLEEKLSLSEGMCLVSLMAANNETGIITSVHDVAAICSDYNAVFHSDMVQYIGHYPIDLANEAVHYASASGHKFHGPKGTGILYIKEGFPMSPLLDGGGQERGLRSGTENVAGIVGFAQALHLSLRDYGINKKQVNYLRNHLRKAIIDIIPGVIVNEAPVGEGLYTILSVSIPDSLGVDALTMRLDALGIEVSGGSACSGGGGSHVMATMHRDKGYETIRFSFSQFNRAEEIIKVIKELKEIFKADSSI